MPDSYAINIITPAPTPITIGTANVGEITTTPVSHTHPASQISDSTAAGRALLTAANVAAQHAALGKLGAANMADALSGSVNPNAVRVSGVDYPGINGILLPSGTTNNRQKWNSQGVSSPVAPYVELRHTGTDWYLVLEHSEDYSATNTTLEATPVGLDGWLSNGGSEPSIDWEITPSHLGQLYRDTVNNVWYRATSIDPPAWELDASGGGGVTDHGALTGLADDDHTQYHTDARGDARYAPLAHTHELDELAATGIAAGKVLTANGAAAATWETPSSSAWDGDIADINLDGGTDIGAGLADADLILVDDGATGTNRKSALSRVWTYIKAKIDAGLTITGNQSFSGQIELTNQSATNATSAMTRALGDTRYGERIIATSTVDASYNDNNVLYDVTGLTGISLAANTYYLVEFIGLFGSTQTDDAPRVCILSDNAFSGSISAQRGSGFGMIGAISYPAPWYYNSTSLVQIINTAIGVVTTSKLGNAYGHIRTGSASTVKVQFAHGAGSGTATLYAGAKIIFTKIP